MNSRIIPVPFSCGHKGLLKIWPNLSGKYNLRRDRMEAKFLLICPKCRGYLPSIYDPEMLERWKKENEDKAKMEQIRNKIGIPDYYISMED